MAKTSSRVSVSDLNTSTISVTVTEEMTKADAVTNFASFLEDILPEIGGVAKAHHPLHRDGDFSAYVIVDTNDGGKYQLKITCWSMPDASVE